MMISTIALLALSSLSVTHCLIYDITPKKMFLPSASFDTKLVTSRCMCKIRCLVLPQCQAWSLTLDNNELECRLADHTPTSSELVDDDNAILGALNMKPATTTSLASTTTTTLVSTSTMTLAPRTTTTLASPVTKTLAPTTTLAPATTPTLASTTSTTLVPTTTTLASTTTTTLTPTTTANLAPTTTPLAPTTTTPTLASTTTTLTPTTIANLALTTTPLAPTATTTLSSPAMTTLTSTTTRKTTFDPNIYKVKFFKEKVCGDKQGSISTISLNPSDSKRSFPKYSQCFAVDSTYKTDKNNEELVSTGGDGVSPQSCSGNRVLVGFKAYDNFDISTGIFSNEVSSLDNPPYLAGVCQYLEIWTVNTGLCDTVTATTTVWTGAADSNVETEKWDYYFSCQPFYTAVKVTRQLHWDQWQIVSIKCCAVA
ncbi:hypothetical protein SK128_006960 [Halocaridina rubra]|uniref:Apple domain-containing protein n=1 Tax=Halocaridina rubra TaxID=373956 RepID=A0AAN8X040_HALRR